jgi:hypothetical protein
MATSVDLPWRWPLASGTETGTGGTPLPRQRIGTAAFGLQPAWVQAFFVFNNILGVPFIFDPGI